MKHNPALDGVRGLAISLVLLFHFFGWRGGWIGVDVFFCLSGYLITSILRSEIEASGRIDFRRFYWRRFVRLAPALFLLSAALLAWSRFSSHGAAIRSSVWVAILYLQNWAAPLGLAGRDLSMGHTWSLSTEEQFYLLWPLLLPLVIRSRRPLLLLGWAVVLMMTAKAIAAIDGVSDWWLIYSLPLRPVGLIVGCWIAFAPIKLWRFAWAPALLGLVLMALSVGQQADVLAAFGASCFTAVLILGAPPGFAIWPLRYLGRISYGLYLYHWPIVVLGDGHASRWALLALSLIAAALSFEFIEKPCLRLKGAGLRSTARMRLSVDCK